jgi:divalent metal cation (Fe/Co/Zn/Cd) transporter
MLSGLVVGTHSIELLFFGEESVPNALALYAAAFAILSKETLFWITYRVGVREKSDVSNFFGILLRFRS